ncbi:MAG: DUF349 domain-containing protein [Bacteroidia bacterium]|nr:DUF349 domain-containing protein [Bacteroidia bacterium]
MLLNENPDRDQENMEEVQDQLETSVPTTNLASDIDAVVESSPTPESVEESEPVVAQEVEAAQSEPAPALADTPETPSDADSEDESDDRDDDFVGEFDDSDDEFVAPAAPEGHQALVAQIDALITQHEPGANLLTDHTIPSLIQLVNWMAYDHGQLNQNMGRVNLVREAFDALKAAESMSHAMEKDFRGAFATFNRQRSKQQQSRSEIKTENSRKKRELIQRLQEIVNFNNPDLIGEVRNLQDEWKTIGQVPQHELESMYKEYRTLLDEFYELRSAHLELLEYDRKKNLEERERLIEVAKSLIPAESEREDEAVWKDKLDLLQELQQQWKASGHVPREEMDRINEAYRTAIDAFFEVRQGFREIEDRMREESAAKKLEILEKLEEFREYKGESPKQWNDVTQTIRSLQEAWKELGPAPSKQNGELWSKYREVCNAFFANKSAFFKSLDEVRTKNLDLKKDLVEKAEAIAKRTDWEAAARDLKTVQTQWKEVGPVPDRYSQKMWNRFRVACDEFFESRRLHYAVLHAEEKDNLAVRRALIDEVKALAESEKGRNEIVEAVKDLQNRWKESGRVPYKEKEKIWQEFRGEIDKIFGGMDTRRGEVRREKVVAKIENIDNEDDRSRTIKDNIARIRKKISYSQEKVDQYSINIQFIARGKSGDALRDQIQKEIDQEMKLIKDLKKEIKTLDELLKGPVKEVVVAPEAAPVVAEAPAEVEEVATVEAVEEVAQAVVEEVVVDSAPEEVAAPNTEEEKTEE